MNKQNFIAALCVLSFPLLLLGAAPIALNGGGAPSWSGGSFASVSTTSASGCAAYSFSAEPTLGFGSAADDNFCIGSTGGSAYVNWFKSGTDSFLKFNTPGTVGAPNIAEYDLPTTGLVIPEGDADPAIYVSAGIAEVSIGVMNSRNALCWGAWNSATIPCFTNSGDDLVMKFSDGSAYTGIWNIGGGSVRAALGTAAAPSYVWANQNTGPYSSGANVFNMSINGTNAGVIGSYTASELNQTKPAAGYYIKIDDGSDKTDADCNSNGETGRLFYDSTNHKFYACNEQSSTRAGWDYASLTD
jgi:hypothetical protein